MTSGEIRNKFLQFFENKGHTIVPSDLLVPRNDPTLLFTGAGMNQFKEEFMGKNVTYTRATSSQKCLRTGDLDNVGKTPRHHTFFEMLGNFSFGDYFKKEAIAWAWEFMTRVMEIPAERLWVSVHKDDVEAYGIWLNEVGVPVERIIKLGDHDNFWPADAPSKGPNGPCGPCSEIFYDWGKNKGCGAPGCGPACDCGRFVEVWNLVFTQFERKPDGKLVPLPKKNIDTGMGLERIVSVMQDVKTNFETDLFVPITEAIKRTTGEMPASGLNLIADHVRAAVFAIADGVSPSNEKRGYVVRKLIRRAWLKGNTESEPFLYTLVPVVAEIFRDVYPQIEEKREHIAAIIREEERRFNETLRSAVPVLEEKMSSGFKVLSGEDVFKLVDTYGMPLDVIIDMCSQKGVEVKINEFEALMEKRKEQSRKGSDLAGEFIFQPDLFMSAPKPEFSEDLPLESEIAFMVRGETVSDTLEEGQDGEIITSPQSGVFYAESGGQVGDTGSMVKPGGYISILNTFDSGGKRIYRVRVEKGTFKRGDKVCLDLDAARKTRTAMNHTATHLLQAALRTVLGGHIKQSGSLVDHRHLRFDFTHMKKLSDREIARVEGTVNDWIAEGTDICKESKSISAAKEEGALSFFGEKYGDTVRVITVGERSKELCGGTHVNNTAEIRLFKITSESSVASGVRRIEAVTGEAVEDWIRSELKALMTEVKDRGGFVSGPKEDEVMSRAQNIIDGRVPIDRDIISAFETSIRPGLMEIKERTEKAAKRIERDRREDAFNEFKLKMDDAAGEPETVGGTKLVSCLLEGADMQVLRKAASYLEKRAGDSIVLLGGGMDDKAYLVCAVPLDLAKKGMSAREIVCAAASIIQGSGGGKDTFAQAGGKSLEKLADAIRVAREHIEQKRIT
jgi:alanyl-tRNA synthetase